MRKTAMVLLSICFGLTTITGWTLNDGFSQLVDSVESSGLKSKLIKFKDKGLEKPLYIGSVEPDQVIEEAYTYLGVPHRTGKRSRSGIDCSGLIAVSFDKFGIELPYSADEQARYGTVIPDRSSLRKGDLVFFTGTYSTSKFITHVGIYMGDDEFIHASSSKGVTVSKLSEDYWADAYVFATRVFPVEPFTHLSMRPMSRRTMMLGVFRSTITISFQ